MAWFAALDPVLQAFLATCFTWFVTALGAGLVFVFKSVNRKVLDAMLGFAAGVMLAASFWSLLAPAISLAADLEQPAWLPATAGLWLGGGFLWAVDKTLPHLHLGLPVEQAEGIATGWQRTILLVLAITLHTGPEGLAVGVAFGAVSLGLPAASLGSAIALASASACKTFPRGRRYRSRSAVRANRALRASGMGSCRLSWSRWPACSEQRRLPSSGRCCPMPWRLRPGR